MDSFSSLVALLAERARSQSGDRAYAFLGDRGAEEAALSYGELHDAAQALAARLAGVAQRGDRAVLVFPPGLEFIVAFFGCLIAGVIAVPMMMPRRNSARDSSAAILADCEPAIALTTPALRAPRRSAARVSEREGLQWLAVDLGLDGPPTPVDRPLPASDDIAFLQYTSGSTSDPKGVAVSHANLLANLEMIRLSLGNSSAVDLCQLGAALSRHGADPERAAGALCRRALRADGAERVHAAAAELAARDPHLSRRSRLQSQFRLRPLRQPLSRPSRWKGSTSPRWKVALNGAEPVRAETITRFTETFAPHGFQPERGVSGLRHGGGDAADLRRRARRGSRDARASASAGAAGPSRRRAAATMADAQTLVGCGRALAGERIAIVDPDNRRAPCRRTRSARSGSAARTSRARYWRNDAATRAGLQARIDGEDDAACGCAPAISVSSMSQANCSSPAASRISSSSAASTTIRRISSTPCRRCIQRLRENGGAAFSVPDDERRGDACRRAGDRAHRAPQDRCRRDQRPDPRRRHRPARIVRAPHRADPPGRVAEDHQRQDPARLGTKALARRTVRYARRQDAD